MLDSRNRNHSIEGLRAIAVLMVFNVHFFGQHYLNQYYSEDDKFIQSIFRTIHAGHIGVDVFL